MKTTVIEVHDMLSVWSVEEVEKRIGEVPSVESVTVNFAATKPDFRSPTSSRPCAEAAINQRANPYPSR
jgi:P-type Cu2+ transporter